MPHSTLKAALIDRLHEQASDRETAYISAQCAVPASRLLCVAEILTGYQFTPCRRQMRVGQDGKLLRGVIRIANPEDPKDRFIVTCNLETGEEHWSVRCPKSKKQYGPIFIEAAQMRIANNKIAQRLREVS